MDELPNVSHHAHEREFTMDEFESLSHTKWECKYHVVFIPKCRRKTLYAELRRHLGEVAFSPRMVCTWCGVIGADARPNWSERRSHGSM
jgi:hypothetical protein